MGITSIEARKELANRKTKLKALEDMTEEEKIEEGFFKPYAVTPNWHKSLFEHQAVNAVKNKKRNFETTYYLTDFSTFPISKLTFRPKGEKRGIFDKEFSRAYKAITIAGL